MQLSNYFIPEARSMGAKYLKGQRKAWSQWHMPWGGAGKTLSFLENDNGGGLTEFVIEAGSRIDVISIQPADELLERYMKIIKNMYAKQTPKKKTPVMSARKTVTKTRASTKTVPRTRASTKTVTKMRASTKTVPRTRASAPRTRASTKTVPRTRASALLKLKM
tara:strand:- start:232 stop:723 length:492 start_codon:yes stop_codon:yes gene_type:complete